MAVNSLRSWELCAKHRTIVIFLTLNYRSSGHRLHFLYPLEGGHKSIHTQYPDGSPPLRKPIQHADS